jgi:ribosome-binding ATPase YchF (GTP1/OBG family)
VEREQPLRLVAFDANERRAIQGYQFLTAKPLLALVNYGEAEAAGGAAAARALHGRVTASGIEVDAFSGKIEMEMAQLSDEDAREFMAEYGITESALTRIIASAYRMLGLITFLTAGDDECRAWAIRRGMNAQEAAGEIHTDLSARFIRAEVVHFEDFVAHGSYAACKEKGLWRLEGKEYIVRDGDMLLIRHSG